MTDAALCQLCDRAERDKGKTRALRPACLPACLPADFFFFIWPLLLPGTSECVDLRPRTPPCGRQTPWAALPVDMAELRDS